MVYILKLTEPFPASLKEAALPHADYQSPAQLHAEIVQQPSYATLRHIDPNTGQFEADLAIQALLRNPTISSYLEQLMEHDLDTAKHSIRVARLAYDTARDCEKPDGSGKFGFTQALVVAAAGLLHDVGKLDIPIEILGKPGRLTEEENTLMRSHPEFGLERLKGFGISPVLVVALCHHQFKTSAPYPAPCPEKILELCGWDEDLARRAKSMAEIVATCDVCDALAVKRAYQDSQMNFEQVCRIVRDDCKGLGPLPNLVLSRLAA